MVPSYREKTTVRMLLQRIEPVLEQIGTYGIIFYSTDGSPSRTAAITAQQGTSDRQSPPDKLGATSPEFAAIKNRSQFRAGSCSQYVPIARTQAQRGTF